MKKFIITFFMFVGVVGLGFQYLSLQRPCVKPLKYSVGQFDTQFGISKFEFIIDLEKAEKVWEDASHKDLFTYDPNANFKINLIYDNRQQATEQKQKAEYGLTEVENSFRAIESSLALVKKNYESENTKYESKAGSFKIDQANYEDEVAYYNARGGAEQSKFNELTQKSRELNVRASELNVLASELNTSVKGLNSLVQKRNLVAEEYNKVLQGYNQKYGNGLEFDQAEYTGKAINVYQFKLSSDLTLALAHEFGHALGMEHVEGVNSIMYYLTSDTNGSIPKLSTEDLSELSRVCRFE